MQTNKHANEKLSDLNDKVQNAKEAVRGGEGGDRDKADLKLLEQEAAAEKMKAKRPEKSKKADTVDAKLDKALSDSFPGSDPVSFVQAAPIKPEDRKLSTVPDDKSKK